MARPVYVIPRSVFDARLVQQAVGAGAELRRHRVKKVEVTTVGVTIDDALTAPLVIGADGAYSAVRRGTGHRTHARRALAIRGYVATPPQRAGLQVIRYGERRQPSYAWSFDRGDGFANVGYGELLSDSSSVTRAELLRELEELLPGSVPARTGADSVEWKAHHLPLSGWRAERSNGRVLLVGDAAGLVNPMTGEGIFYAVATGAIAGRCAAASVVAGRADRAGREYRSALGRLLDRHLRHTWMAGRLTRSPAVIDAGIRAAARDRSSFDALVELGLGDGRITPRLIASLGRALVSDGSTRG